jgi:hypothetical protein
MLSPAVFNLSFLPSTPSPPSLYLLSASAFIHYFPISSPLELCWIISKPLSKSIIPFYKTVIERNCISFTYHPGCKSRSELFPFHIIGLLIQLNYWLKPIYMTRWNSEVLKLFAMCWTTGVRLQGVPGIFFFVTTCRSALGSQSPPSALPNTYKGLFLRVQSRLEREIDVVCT